ncbi:hypothetical protein SAMN05216605_1301 [Pseudomonas abietaniphila]|uniref:Uncharacterized protein n=1 Tax=Pseudomonas abietaniphila TaxID=89065 RepID=A0A1G8TPW8_9PSED|nr:hypothetical protein SAMN05216605_1301 [Pseudomonas abietaniphila]
MSGPTLFLWETSEVTRAVKAACRSPPMYLSHRIRHCRNLQQLLQVSRQSDTLVCPIWA